MRDVILASNAAINLPIKYWLYLKLGGVVPTTFRIYNIDKDESRGHSQRSYSSTRGLIIINDLLHGSGATTLHWQRIHFIERNQLEASANTQPRRSIQS